MESLNLKPWEFWIAQSRAYVEALLSTKLSANLRFHNLNHTQEVVQAAERLAAADKLPEEKRGLLLLAAWFHDCGYTESYIGHEEISMDLADAFLNNLNFPDALRKQVLKLIEATRYGHRPKTRLEALLIDADRANMGTRDFLQRGELLRYEWKHYLQKTYQHEDWLYNQLQYLEETSFQTESAEKLWGAQRKENLQALKEALGQLGKPVRPKVPKNIVVREWLRYRLGAYLWSVVLGCAIGLTMNVAVWGSSPEVMLSGLFGGLVIGLMLRAGDSAFDRYVLRKFSFPVSLGLGSVLLIFLFVTAELTTLALFSWWGYGGEEEMSALFEPSLLFVLAWNAFLMSILLNFIKLATRIVGPRILWNYVRGKYHKPTGEERIFMFIDLNSSTRMAETMSMEKYHALLSTFFSMLSSPVARYRGEIYQYVGDEAVITWNMREGLRRARCIRCYFRILRQMEKNRSQFIRKFGFVPDFKVGIHGGWVITGEIGKTKTDIVFHGDVINTTERILNQCGSLQSRVLISEYLIRRMDLPADIQATFVKTLLLKGKEKEIGVYTLDRNRPQGSWETEMHS